MAFEDDVFVNCPFDADYKSLLKPLLFTILHLGLQPRISLDLLNVWDNSCLDTHSPMYANSSETGP